MLAGAERIARAGDHQLGHGDIADRDGGGGLPFMRAW
jgi:hypothetical protein